MGMSNNFYPTFMVRLRVPFSFASNYGDLDALGIEMLSLRVITGTLANLSGSLLEGAR